MSGGSALSEHAELWSLEGAIPNLQILDAALPLHTAALLFNSSLEPPGELF